MYAVVVVLEDDKKSLPKTVYVGVTERTLTRMGLSGGFKRMRAARNRAAEEVYGHGCVFESEDSKPNLGKVLKRAKDGSLNVIATKVLMRVFLEGEG